MNLINADIEHTGRTPHAHIHTQIQHHREIPTDTDFRTEIR